MARTPEQFFNEMKIIHPDIEVIGLYTKAVEPVLVRCLTCGNSVTSFEVFNILPLEIPILKKISVLLVPSNNIKKTIISAKWKKAGK